MNFKEFYNPKKVYEGYFEYYFLRPFYHQYADFGGHESGKSLLLSFTSWLTVTLGVVGILMGQVGLLGPEVGFSCMLWGSIVWLAISLVPLMALFIRATHGEPEKPHKARFLGIDTMLAVSCLLFFLLGLLMMITTLNSGTLDPNGRPYDESDSAVSNMEEVVEEPIFTYQDEMVEEPVSDSSDALSDMTEPDLVTPEESFDPSIQTPHEELDTVF